MSELKAATERLRGNWYDAYGCTEEGLTRECLRDIALVVSRADSLRALLNDKEYIQLKADYNRGHLSHHG